MSIPIQELRELSLKFKCEVDCSSCSFLSQCKQLDKENFKYSQQLAFPALLKDVKDSVVDPINYIVLPALNAVPFDKHNNRKKLHDILLSICYFASKSEKCTIVDIASMLNISILKARSRLKCLIEKKLVNFDVKGHTTIFTINQQSSDEVTDKYNQFKSAYVEFFSNKFERAPHLSSTDFIIAKKFCKSTQYTAEQLRKLMDKYFQLNNLYLRSKGYPIRNFSTSLHEIFAVFPYVLDDNADAPSSVDGAISEEQLHKYIEGKMQGQWTGNEEWSQAYEKILKSRVSSALEL